MKKIFDSSCFLGYVNQVSPQGVQIHFPSSKLLNNFRHEGTLFNGANVGDFVVIEGVRYGFLARIVDLSLPDSERKSIDEKSIHESESIFHPIATAELLLSFDLYCPDKLEKTVAHFPPIGAKVFACSEDLLKDYIKSFGAQNDESCNVYAEIGSLSSHRLPCSVSINSIFNRHCAVVGTTGGGKSWTVARLIESLKDQTSNKVILVDATGEYDGIADKNYILGTDAYFPYTKLTIADLFYLLRPTGQSQRPILLEAIRSLKLVRIAQTDPLYSSKTSSCQITITPAGQLQKANQQKRPVKLGFYVYRDKINNSLCDFDINNLIGQINEECVYQSSRLGDDYYGDRNLKDYDYQTSLICRIAELLSNPIFSNLFGFSKGIPTLTSITDAIDTFLKSKEEQVLRICFSQVPSSFFAKEIVANALASHMLSFAREGKFSSSPLVMCLDEAHQFLNKNVSDDFFSTQPLRLINDQDRKTIESACSSANKNSLSLLPVLGAGEALLLGVDFPMPLTLKIKAPSNPPNSKTPMLTRV